MKSETSLQEKFSNPFRCKKIAFKKYIYLDALIIPHALTHPKHHFQHLVKPEVRQTEIVTDSLKQYS